MTNEHIVAAGVVADTDGVKDDSVEAVERSLETLSNGALGYETLIDEVDDTELRALVRQLATERKELVENVLRMAADSGYEFEANTDGTVPGKIHRTWLKIESSFSDDAALVDSVMTAESYAITDMENVLDLDIDRGFKTVINEAASTVAEAKQRLAKWAAAQAS